MAGGLPTPASRSTAQTAAISCGPIARCSASRWSRTRSALPAAARFCSMRVAESSSTQTTRSCCTMALDRVAPRPVKSASACPAHSLSPHSAPLRTGALEIGPCRHLSVSSVGSTTRGERAESGGRSFRGPAYLPSGSVPGPGTLPICPLWTRYTLRRDFRRRLPTATWVARVARNEFAAPKAVDQESRSLRNILCDHLGRDVLWVNSRFAQARVARKVICPPSSSLRARSDVLWQLS
jgi:hypothetical protein